MALEDRLLTEARNPRSAGIDGMSALEIVHLMNAEDAGVLSAVRAESSRIAAVVDLVADRFRSGGRLFYSGAGTSGRLGVLDASECPPTFSTPPDLVQGVIAGGLIALTTAVENAEDQPEQGAADLAARGLCDKDVLVGIATSGRTPYVLGAVAYAKRIGAATVGLVCNAPSLLADQVDYPITLLVGPEIIAGSTRLKSGTATKMVLNMITTGAMVRFGKTFGNRMVDLNPANEKLRLRTRRMLRELTGISDSAAQSLLAECGGALKPALVRAWVGCTTDEAIALLDEHHGHIAKILKARGITPPVDPIQES